jgi:hypothetical protein
MITDQSIYEALPSWAKFLALGLGFRPELPPASVRRQRRELAQLPAVQPWGVR